VENGVPLGEASATERKLAEWSWSANLFPLFFCFQTHLLAVGGIS
jgi:hypothetical protein